MYMCFACTFDMYHMHAWYLWRPERLFASPKPGVTDSSGSSCECRKSNLVTLQDQQIPLTWLTDRVPKCNFFLTLSNHAVNCMVYFLSNLLMLNALFKVILRKFYLKIFIPSFTRTESFKNSRLSSFTNLLNS